MTYSWEATLIVAALNIAGGAVFALIIALLGGPWISAVAGAGGGILGWLVVNGITALHARLRPNTNRETA